MVEREGGKMGFLEEDRRLSARKYFRWRKLLGPTLAIGEKKKSKLKQKFKLTFFSPFLRGLLYTDGFYFEKKKHL